MDEETQSCCVCHRTIRTKLAIPTFFFTFANIFQVVALATPYWYYATVHQDGGYHIKETYGLWRICSNDDSKCFKINEASSEPAYLGGWLQPVRALEVLGMVALAVSMCLFFLSFCCKRRSRALTTASLVICFSAGITIVTGSTMLYTRLKLAQYLDVSFGLAIAAGGFALITSVFLLANVFTTPTSKLKPFRPLMLFKTNNYSSLQQTGSELEDRDLVDGVEMTGYPNPLHGVLGREGESVDSDDDNTQPEAVS